MAQIDVLFEGYVREGGSRVGGTVSLIRDGEAVIVVDPGLVPDRSSILSPLQGHGVSPDSVTDVILSHHHPDHTVHVALFPNARIHDHWAIYRGDLWESRPAEGFQVSPDVQLLETPGHTPQDISTVVTTEDGIVALTHLWWSETGPEEDPLATNQADIHKGRERVLELATWIVPGHGPKFRVTSDTPR